MFVKTDNKDMVHLRKLTEKSSLEGLHWSKSKVGSLLHSKPYDILKIYYTYEKIDFSDEVIEKLTESFPNFFRIGKPGIFDGDWKSEIFPSTNYSNKSYQELTKLIRAKKANNQFIHPELMRFYKIKKNEFLYNKLDKNEGLFTKSSLMFQNRKYK